MNESHENDQNLSLLQMLEIALSADVTQDDVSTHGEDIVRTTYRVPRAVLAEVTALAQANRMSVSQLINLLLDAYLTGQGRPGYATLAPNYPSYVLRIKTQSD
jgi:predicted DNA-binding ribbon-helix-helix protein